jgi:outer membrane biogenesis lipoprotein LolB
MKYRLTFFLIFFIPSLLLASQKSSKEVVIESASQFQRWCKSLSYRHLSNKHQQPFNWSATTIRQLNDYQTSGSWAVNNDEKKVFCQIRIGKKAKKTKITIH